MSRSRWPYVPARPNSHVPVAACRSMAFQGQEAWEHHRGNRQPELTGAPRVSHGGRGLKQRRRGLFWSLPARPKAGVTEEATTSLPACGRDFPSKPWQQSPFSRRAHACFVTGRAAPLSRAGSGRRFAPAHRVLVAVVTPSPKRLHDAGRRSPRAFVHRFAGAGGDARRRPQGPTRG